ncbi:hypothetical protein [Rhodovibrio salinarum]|nr:hypothetical protein [Rhodovibrio salinarum]
MVALPSAVARQLDVQMADLGTPAFVDGFAGLVLAHAGRDATRARAMAKWVVDRVPNAAPEVARALELAGFAPLGAGLAAKTRSAHASPVLSGVPGGDGVRAVPGAAVGTRDLGGGGGGRTRGGSGGAGGGAALGSAPGYPAPISARQTFRPAPDDLATPQLR